MFMKDFESGFTMDATTHGEHSFGAADKCLRIRADITVSGQVAPTCQEFTQRLAKVIQSEMTAYAIKNPT